MSALTDDEIGQKALESAGDFLKVTTGLATGALVFSTTLLNNPGALTGAARWVLSIAWAALLISIGASVFVAQGRITTKIAKKNYDIHNDLWLTRPTVIHQWTFFGGILALGVTLGIVLGNQPSTEALQVPKATDAVRLAISRVPRSVHIVKVDAIDLIKGADATDPTLETWHIQLDGTVRPPASRTRQSPAMKIVHLDAIVDAKTREVYLPYQP